MIYGSACSGIEAATIAWEPLGWEPAWFSEIDPFPSAVLAHHWPDVPNLGDLNKIHNKEIFRDRSIDILVGGTPCQSFSISGLRKGMDDPRGNLALAFVGIAARARPRWIVWENVPGVLSTNGGRDFGTFLGALGSLGYGFAYRILDAQYFGVPQRRRRVFVVGYLGSWSRAAAVLFERESLQRNPAEGSKARKGTPGDSPGSAAARCFRWQNENEGLVEDTRTGSVLSSASKTYPYNVPGYIVKPLAFEPRFARGKGKLPCEVSPTISADTDRGDGQPAVCYPTLATGPVVRRFSPLECERLQGFPDFHTLIPWDGRPGRDVLETVQYIINAGFTEGEAHQLALTPDGQRYKACGNSMAVPVMAFIGRRIQMVEEIINGSK